MLLVFRKTSVTDLEVRERSHGVAFALLWRPLLAPSGETWPHDLGGGVSVFRFCALLQKNTHIYIMQIYNIYLESKPPQKKERQNQKNIACSFAFVRGLVCFFQRVSSPRKHGRKVRREEMKRQREIKADKSGGLGAIICLICFFSSRGW